MLKVQHDFTFLPEYTYIFHNFHFYRLDKKQQQQQKIVLIVHINISGGEEHFGILTMTEYDGSRLRHIKGLFAKAVYVFVVLNMRLLFA